MRVDFKDNIKLLDQFKTFTSNHNGNHPHNKIPVLGLGLHQEKQLVEEQTNKYKTVVYGVVKIYHYPEFEKLFLGGFNRKLNSSVCENAPYDALLPCVLYTNHNSSFSYKGVIDIYPTSLVFYGNLKEVVLVGGVKPSPCKDHFYRDIPIKRARNPVEFKDIEGNTETMSDFSTVLMDTSDLHSVSWDKFLDWNFNVVGRSDVASLYEKPKASSYIIKLNSLEENHVI